MSSGTFDSRADVVASANCFEYYGNLATQLWGEQIPMNGPLLDYTLTPTVGEVTLDNGFLPDPHEVAVTAGGQVSVSSALQNECRGYEGSGSTHALLRSSNSVLHWNVERRRTGHYGRLTSVAGCDGPTQRGRTLWFGRLDRLRQLALDRPDHVRHAHAVTDANGEIAQFLAESLHLDPHVPAVLVHADDLRQAAVAGDREPPLVERGEPPLCAAQY